MAQGTCSIDGCDVIARCKGMCEMHYARLKRRGTTDEPPPRRRNICSIDGCNDFVQGQGLCPKHYARWRKRGSTDDPPTDSERFWTRVNKGAPNDCWLWTGPPLTYGYGSFTISNPVDGATTVKPHRFAYEDLIGPIPAGLHLDHTCHNRDLTCNKGDACPHRRCVNPAHLEPTTPGENTLRGRSPSTANLAKTHCHRGHEFTPDNTRMKGHRRICRKCQREYRNRK